MSVDKRKISSTKFMFTIACFLQSSAMITSIIISVTKHESWLIPIFSSVLYIPLVLVFKTLMQKFPDKTLLGILNEVFGKVLGKIFGVFYLLLFLILTALNLNDLGHFSKMTVMYESPHLVLTIICMLVVVYAVRGGAKVVTRYSTIFVITHIFIAIITFLLLSNQMNPRDLLPVFNLPVKRYIQSSHIMLTIPIGETFVLLMFTPFIEVDSKKLTKVWLLGLGIGITTFFVILIRDIITLGNILHLFTLPGFISMRLINLGDAISRVEILFSIALIMLLFFKISILTFVSTLAASEVFNFKEYKKLAVAIGVFLIFLAPFLYPNETNHTSMLREVTPILWSFLEILVPVLLLVIAVLKEKFKKNDLKTREVIKAWDGS